VAGVLRHNQIGEREPRIAQETALRRLRRRRPAQKRNQARRPKPAFDDSRLKPIKVGHASPFSASPCASSLAATGRPSSKSRHKAALVARNHVGLFPPAL